jgi:hypothetical protein
MIRVLLCLALFSTACGGATMNLGVPSPTITRPGQDPFVVYRAAKLTLKELGVVEQASADMGLVEGRIPPYQVKAVMERGAPSITLYGMGGDKGEWMRDSKSQEWVIVVDGKEHRRKGSPGLAEAVDSWQLAIEKALSKSAAAGPTPGG